MKNEVKEFIEDFILIITSFSGIFIGLGFLFLGLVGRNFWFILVGLISLFFGVVSASLLSVKNIKK